LASGHARAHSNKIVEDFSSVIGDAAEVKEGINANHRDMCRCKDIEDEGFIKVSGTIERYVRDLLLLNGMEYP